MQTRPYPSDLAMYTPLMPQPTPLELTEKLLQAVAAADWETYRELCHPELTCFEPETEGHLVEGLEFHAYYFRLGGHMGPSAVTIVAPKVWNLGPEAAVVAYTRLVQSQDEQGRPVTRRFQETRVWQKTADGWKHVHFHRSI
jgi:ketosteroid isomerase-like protein